MPEYLEMICGRMVEVLYLIVENTITKLLESYASAAYWSMYS